MYSDRELFARLIKCEAGGEGEDGMRAVATVVMNRLTTPVGEYSRVAANGGLRNVIMQQYQFTCCMGTVYGEANPQTIWSAEPESIHYEIADWALGGGRLWGVGGALWFLNPYGPCPDAFPYNGSGEHQVRINDHCFYRPTAKYATT